MDELEWVSKSIVSVPLFAGRLIAGRNEVAIGIGTMTTDHFRHVLLVH